MRSPHSNAIKDRTPQESLPTTPSCEQKARSLTKLQIVKFPEVVKDTLCESTRKRIHSKHFLFSLDFQKDALRFEDVEQSKID